VDCVVGFMLFFFVKQKAAYEIETGLEFRRVLFRSSELVGNDPVTWKGNLTQSLENVQLYPKIDKKLDVVVGVGGTPESVVRAAKYNFPVVLAIIGGDPTRFKPLVDLYHRTTRELGKPSQTVGMHSLGVIAETD